MRHALSYPSALGVFVALLGIAGCGESSPTTPASPAAAVASGPVTIDIMNFKFQQSPLTVKAGTQVTWTNRDPQGTSHTATADQGAFDTGPIAPGASVTRTLITAGTFTYHCSIHQYMTATLAVTR